MIISRYLTKEILGTLTGVIFVLLLLFLSNKLVRYLSYAAMGKVAPNILFQLMGFEIPYLLSLLLPLGLYLGVILAYGRLYSDNELRVMHACGLSLTKLVFITGLLASFVTLMVTALMLWVNPWIANHKDKLIANSISTDNILNTLMPGRFQVSPDGRRVLYVEQISRNHKQANNIFMADQGKKQDLNNGTAWSVVSAENGTQITKNNSPDRFLAASRGYRYEGVAGESDFNIVQFKKYAVRLPSMGANSKRQEQEAIPTDKLWHDYQKSENASELQWRISIPFSAFLLSLLAIPLSRVSPRGGRYSQLVPAILIYIIYMNLLFVARSWIEQGFLSVNLGMWWVHLSMFILALLMLTIQSGWMLKFFQRKTL